MAVKVCGVIKNSKADKAGIAVDDILLSINREEISDVLDYRFFMSEQRLALTLKRNSGKYHVFLNKEQYEDIGLEFETYLMDKQRSCKNNCIFCFVDQNPTGMRKSVYFKDDDDRLSFLYGNYITLTNLTDRDVERILSMNLSPINVSVHTTDPDLRVKMMRNKTAGTSLNRLYRLCSGNNIKINTQLVLCPGINDGDALVRTLTDLGELYPSVQSIACVPVGLTGKRGGLFELRPFTKEEAGTTIDIIESFSAKWLEERGDRIVYPADEFFLKAERDIPPTEYYGDFNQLENGVGIIADNLACFEEQINCTKPCKTKRRITVATGVAAAGSIISMCDKAKLLDPTLDVTVNTIPSRFFGGHITVAGLVTGSDIVAELEGADCGNALFIPACMLRHEKDRFLDDMTKEELENKLGVKVIPIDDGGMLAAELMK